MIVLSRQAHSFLAHLPNILLLQHERGSILQAGSYCPDPQTSLICPQGHFCPMQSMNPLPCSWASHCPVGSSLPQITWGTYIGIWILVVALLLFWWTVLLWLQRRKVRSLQSCRQEVAARRQSAIKDRPAAGCELARYLTVLDITAHSPYPTCSYPHGMTPLLCSI